MQNSMITRNYTVVFKSFLSYLPSRIFVILNALIIVPIFAYFLTTTEMSVFQISIGILNLVCTASTDWIAKSVLRFYERYKRFGELDNFFSNIMFLEVLAFVCVFAGYFIFKGFIAQKFYIPENIFLMTLILVVPCGIRQMFYQLLRILKMTVLYTVSIIIYQISLLLLFFAFSNLVEHVLSILLAMVISICIIDCLILYKLKLKEKLVFKFNEKILRNIIIYAIPLFFTNLCIWLILHFGKFAFQVNKDFVNTAIVGTAWFFVTSALTPLFSLLMFAVFPIIIRRFEKNYHVKEFMTSVLNAYIVIFLPYVCVFTFYSFDIARIAFKQEYTNLGILFPFCALTIFVHEFMKLANMKYHLKNRTYIETIISFVVAIFCIALNIVLIKYLGIYGFGIAMLSSITLLFFANSLVKFKYLDYVTPKKHVKCLFMSLLVALISFLIPFAMLFMFKNNIVSVIQIIFFFIIYILLTLKFKKYIL